MNTTKMNFANIQGKLSRTEMKNIMAGVETVGGQDCLDKYSYDCSITGNTSDKCCTGLSCVMNGTGTGTICM